MFETTIYLKQHTLEPSSLISDPLCLCPTRERALLFLARIHAPYMIKEHLTIILKKTMYHQSIVLLISILPLSLAASINSSVSTTIKPTPVALPLFQQAFEQSEKCNDFIESVNNEFHTPNYPEDYHDSLNCVKVISAGPGEVIRLRFLDHFYLEPDEKCRYDYLEVRDGQYGYSTLIATLCGTSPPTVLESSGRHLWLRFHSDQDIHYIGFRASFEFIPSILARPDLDDCSFHLTSMEANITSEDLTPEILLNRKDLSMYYLDCTWVIEAPPGQKIYFQFKDFLLERANDCTYNYVEIYGSRTELYGKDGLMHQYCGSDTKPTFSKSNVLHFRFYTVLVPDNTEVGLSFKTKLFVYYNFYRDLSDKGSATEEPDRCSETEEFDCTDNTCIHKDLECNFQSNCKQANDEDKVKCRGQKATFKMTMDLVVIAFIGCFLAAGMCSGLILNICRKLRQDKIELEEIRASLHKSKDSVTGPTKTEKQKNKSKDELRFVQEVPAPPPSSSPPPASSKRVNLVPPTSQDSSNESTQTVIYKSAVTEPTIPYSPPPPYNPSSTKVQPKYPIKDEEEEEEGGVVQVIEVRDSACQTRESFTEKYLRDVYFGSTRHYSKDQLSAPKRAPLARSEAVDNPPTVIGFKKQLKRVPKGNADLLAYYPRSPGSVCSSVDASTGSLEMLAEDTTDPII